jgi:hypothetical protein
MNKDRRVRVEFAVLMAISLLILWQLAGIAWRSLSALF